MRLSLFVLTRQWVWRRRRGMPWRCGPVSPGCLMRTPCKPISANACRSVQRLPPMVGGLEQLSAKQHPVDPGDPIHASASNPARPRYLKLSHRRARGTASVARDSPAHYLPKLSIATKPDVFYGILGSGGECWIPVPLAPASGPFFCDGKANVCPWGVPLDCRNAPSGTAYGAEACRS